MKQKLLKLIYKFLAFCSRIYIKRNNIFTVGITGSVGKTTCRTVISQVLEKLSEQRIYTSPKNYNSELGLVFSIFKIEDYVPSIKNLFLLSVKIFLTAFFGKKQYDVIVLEYGIDRPLDMEFLLTVNKPDISIFTKLDYTHSEFFGGKKQVGDEKFKLMKAASEKVYLNFSDEYCQEQSPHLTSPQGRGITQEFFWREEDCQNYRLVNNQIFSTLKKGETRGIDSKNQEKVPWGMPERQRGLGVSSAFETLGKTITTNAIGEANMYYINLALRVLEDVEQTGQAHRSAPTEKNVGVNLCAHPENNIHLELTGQKARFNVLEGTNDSVLVDSTYNAAPASMKKIIEDTKTLQKELYPDYKLGFCLGDMREIGPTSGELHKEIYEIVKESELIVVSNPEMTQNFGDNAHKFKTSREAGKFLREFLEKTTDKYLILFKGSQYTVFTEEALVQVLKNKEDAKDLCRQEDFWKKDKDQYFNSLSK